jgi:hypothetical protein
MNFSGLANVVGDVTNNAGAKIISSGGGPTTFHDDVVNNGEIRTAPGSFTVFFGSTNGSGSYTGTGTVDFEGDLKPGNSPAAVSFAGDVVFGPDATLEMEIGGIAAGTQHDQINVAGKLTLDGTLKLSIINGFVPAAGQTFDLLNWGSIAGAFTSLDLPIIPGLAWNTSQFSAGIISVATAGLPGDFNQNNNVNAADFVTWRKTDGTQTGYQTWRSHFDVSPGSGDVISSPSAESLSGAVPEPTSALLLLLGAAVGIRRGNRRLASSR